MQFLLLHLNHGILRLLLGLGLLGLGLICLEELLRTIGHQPGHLNFDVLWQFLVRGRQGHADLLFDLSSILECQMLCNVGHCRRLDLLGHRVLSNSLGNHWILHEGCMSGDVGIVILVDECLGGLPVEECHVLADRIPWCLVIVHWNQLICVLYPQNFNHLTVQIGQVVDLRSLGGQLNHSLILHDPLGHRAGVRVRDGNHLNDVVIRLFCLAVPTLGVVFILTGRIVPDDSLEQFEFLLHGVMDTGLNGSHGLQGSFQNCQGCPYRGLGTHIADLHVRDGTQSASFFCDLIEQSQEGCAWLLIGERHDVVFDRSAWHINVPEFTWGDWRIVSFDPHATGLQSTGQI